jgi:hypothetical protein
MVVETFAPKVRMKDGTDYEPRGWEWIFAFALAGCEWAIEEASKPEFRETIIVDLKKRKQEKLQSTIDFHLKRVEELKEEMRILEQ